MKTLRVVLSVLGFIGSSAALFILAATVTVGYSCFRHGDVGPYPECDWIPWMLPAAMLVVFAAREIRKANNG